ncbi:putative inactive receptor-like protein kinase [Dorcoceras hygrometricum]|uniref:Putative inactive receptor-like protein kinase n=1 Tax=Dorcoceras hygrometricum TaxID=472368 RepID=A0A2Z7AJ16_9LAMI|nr:putative inactive receptor-like protein kinase [Dorcoceras hygrometricum]
MRDSNDLNKMECHDLFANLKAYEFELETRAESEPSTSQPIRSLAITITEHSPCSTSDRSVEEMSKDAMSLEQSYPSPTAGPIPSRDIISVKIRHHTFTAHMANQIKRRNVSSLTYENFSGGHPSQYCSHPSGETSKVSGATASEQQSTADGPQSLPKEPKKAAVEKPKMNKEKVSQMMKKLSDLVLNSE